MCVRGSKLSASPRVCVPPEVVVKLHPQQPAEGGLRKCQAAAREGGPCTHKVVVLREGRGHSPSASPLLQSGLAAGEREREQREWALHHSDWPLGCCSQLLPPYDGR